MPIYAYRCTECSHEFDVLQKVSDAALTTCPACQRQTLAKQLTAAGFQLKGSGWYVTDFRDKSGGKKAAANADSAQGGDAAKSAEPSTGPGAEAKASDSKGSDSKASDAKGADAAASAKPPAAPPPAPASTD